MTARKEPAWMATARKSIGLKEFAGAPSNPTIMDWAKKVGSKIMGIPYTDDSVPWCGLFAAQVFVDHGILPPKIAVRASAWAAFGHPLAEGIPGAILVFTRKGGGHVGFYVSEDRSYYHVLGGNQGDAVSITKIAKERCTAIRWPEGVPVTGKPVLANLTATVSKNEA